MDGAKYANPVGLPESGAVAASDFHELLETLPPSDHVHDITPNLYN